MNGVCMKLFSINRFTFIVSRVHYSIYVCCVICGARGVTKTTEYLYKEIRNTLGAGGFTLYGLISRQVFISDGFGNRTLTTHYPLPTYHQVFTFLDH